MAEDSLLEGGLLVEAGDTVHWAHRGLRELVTERARSSGAWAEADVRCARWLGDRPCEGDVATRLGRHRVAAGDLEGALIPLRQAARDLGARGAFGACNAVLLELLDVMARLGIPPEDPRPLGVRVFLAVNATRQLSRLDEAEAMLDEVQPLALASSDAALVAELWVARGVLEMGRGHLDRAAEAHRASAEAARGAGLVRAEAIAVRHLAHVTGRQGRLSEGVAHHDHAASLMRSLGDELSETHCQIGAAMQLRTLDPERSLALVTTAEAAYRARGMLPGLADCRNLRGELARDAGDLELAREHYLATVELFTLAGLDRVVFPLINLGLVESQLGEWEQARTTFEGVLRLCRHQPFERAWIRAFALGTQVLDPGFEDVFDEVVAAIDAMGAVEPDGIRALGWAADRALAAGLEDRARRCRDVITRWQA